MTESILSWATVVLFLISAYGWGRLCKFLRDARISRFHSLSLILGLAFLNAIGGLLNLFGWATAPTVLGLHFGGAVWAVVDALRNPPWRTVSLLSGPGRDGFAVLGARMKSLVPVLLALFGGAAACVLLVPTTSFNPGDDFLYYMPRAVRMTQTGSVAGSPFDAIGLDSQGSQAFFQGFFLHALKVEWLNGFDAVACFAVCLLFAAELSLRWRLPWQVGALAVTSVAVINPQCVNVSALYSGMSGVMALVVCGGMAAKRLQAAPSRGRFGLELALALLGGMLVTLKTPLGFFAVAYLAILYAILFCREHQRSAVLKSAGVTACLALLVILPWASAHLPVLLKARQLGEEFGKSAVLSGKYPSMSTHDIPRLFSRAESLYGDTYLAFDIIVVICGVLGLVSFLIWLRQANRSKNDLRPSVAAAGFGVVVTYLINADLFKVLTAIRFSCPVMIGVFSVICLATLRLHARSKFGAWIYAIGAGLFAFAIILFAGTFRTRVLKAIHYRALSAYPINSNFTEYTAARLSGQDANYYRALQSLILPRATVLVWAVAPFRLDFARNRLLTVAEVGLATPLLRFPAGLSLESLQEYLRKWNVRYIMVETDLLSAKNPDYLRSLLQWDEVAYQKVGEFNLYFRESLFELARRHPVIYQDDRMLLFELVDSPRQPATTPPQGQ
jgi:hypothetical protein